MRNVETEPTELYCGTPADGERSASVPQIDVLAPRDVPLCGPRAGKVRRTLPQRGRTLNRSLVLRRPPPRSASLARGTPIGPDDVAVTGGMDVAPHPHTGLQTVSRLFSGEIEHRDSLGSHALVRPGELNLMTGGYGISHSEVSTGRTTVLHGVQLWVALPEQHRYAERDFQHYVPGPVRIAGAEVRVFLGSFAGDVSPVPTFTPLLGAEIVLEPRAAVTFAVGPGLEHGLLVAHGPVRMADTLLRPAELRYTDTGTDTLTLANESDDTARAVLLGGTPFDEQIVMWWNFIGRSHAEIVRAREDWQNASRRFGAVQGYDGDRLPAPVP
ncbi:redox-sensitive bicupin YhaK (pirin superfamily) [Streptomyces turgidiscabies]|uniref:Redox-sensitive bicupin YhaK (Pirin superfamily) n=1 Tax=Streptomyces turgidiscabies TaxID=85558 RepID=A0ABU0RUI1_9ACTN|nr:redox-sensitive bicupin YhaK (pirin superfamily) [Streptomyces turgidiscabies]